MKFRLLIVFVVTSALISCGGAQTDSTSAAERPETDEAAEADAEKSAIEQLTVMGQELETELDELVSPIEETETLIDQITSIPDRVGIDRQSLMAMALATLESGQVDISTDIELTAEAKAEIQAALTKLQTIVAKLKSLPTDAVKLSSSVSEASAKVPVLVSKVSTQAQLKLSNPLASAEAKAQAQADIEAVEDTKVKVETKILKVKNKTAEVPNLAKSALSKLTSTFTGGV